MSALRWILLLAGLLFIAALAWRESRRGRQDAPSGMQRVRREDPPLDPVDANGADASPLWANTSVATHATVIDTLPIVQLSPEQMAALPVSELGAVTQVDFLVGPEPEPEPEPESLPAPSIAEWPAEELRRICSLRLTPQRQERFPGRALRQGLMSAGFQHGELGIFHRAGSAGCAMMSVANLSRPGQLDPAMMDYQRFAGLHLFTVLPGRVSNRMALQQLFVVADELAQRLDGVVQDVSGKALDAARMADLQQQFVDDMAAVAAAE
jgi:cell division protein ZipA